MSNIMQLEKLIRRRRPRNSLAAEIMRIRSCNVGIHLETVMLIIQVMMQFFTTALIMYVPEKINEQKME